MNILKSSRNKSHAIIKATIACFLAHSLSSSSLLASGSEDRDTTLASQFALTGNGQGSFADFSVEGDYINTGDWMGWVHIRHYPLVYFYTTQTWGYDAGSNWVYLYGADQPPSGSGGIRGPAYDEFGSFFVRIYISPSAPTTTYNYDVDTEGWLAWVNVAKHPWFYLYSYQTWAYDAGGNWFYISK